MFGKSTTFGTSSRNQLSNDMLKEKKKKDDIELLLDKIDKGILCEFIKEECAGNRQFKQRFLALGVGIIFRPKSEDYQSRVISIIKDFEGRHGYVEYRDTHNLNCAIIKIIEEADVAIRDQRWDVAIAILEGVANAGEYIINCGDDSDGELGGIVEECFSKWLELCSIESLPSKIKSKIFELAIGNFIDRHLNGWDWWWSWIEMAILLADNREKLERINNALDDIINTQGDEWSVKYNRDTAQQYKLEIMSKSGTPEEQRSFMYENVGNPDFRRRLLQMACDESKYDEVLSLAKDGITHDSKYAGLVNEWHKWELKAYRHIDDKANTLTLARYFFFKGARFDEKEYSMETMYTLMKSIVPNENWKDFVGALIKESSKKRSVEGALFIYTQEKMWDIYMEYLRNTPTIHNIDETPREVWKLYKEELVKLYATCIRRFFQIASNRNSYRDGVKLLRKLIKYGGKIEADTIIVEQKKRIPYRPALIDELSKL